MMKRALFTFFALTAVATTASAENIDYSCHEKAETEYAYDSENLLHAYETARIAPSDFEKSRDRLVAVREKALGDCQRQFFVEIEHRADNSLAVVNASPVAADRAPASIAPVARSASGYEYIDAKPPVAAAPSSRGSFEVGASSQEQYDDDGAFIYTGDRVGIEN